MLRRPMPGIDCSASTRWPLTHSTRVRLRPEAIVSAYPSPIDLSRGSPLGELSVWLSYAPRVPAVDPLFFVGRLGRFEIRRGDRGRRTARRFFFLLDRGLAHFD